MPTVINGIGTWHYGKDRIHRRKGVCSFCNAVGELASYDTTLYFVVFFIPLLPLARRRILEACPSCQQHRYVRLKEWEARKAESIARLLEKLEADPDNRDTVLEAIALATGYQDEPLFNQVTAGLAEHRRDDAVIQAQLGYAYAYFARWPEAEAAFAASLAVEDNPEIRRQLALALLKQGRPDQAEPHLRHILDQALEEHAGMIYLLVEAYQAQGRHVEALELMDRRDAVFSRLAKLKEYKQQRRLSERHQHSGKPIRSAFLEESRQVGYREGGWKARVARLSGPLILLSLLLVYLGAAVWIGQTRKVYLVNGWEKAYTVAINGREHTLSPGAAMAVRLPEGEVTIEFSEARPGFEPVRCRVETPFFTRPFANHTFVLNPDRLAILVWEEAEYAENPGPTQQEYHLGEVLYAFQGLDYEFAPFPATLQIEKNQTLKKQRIDLMLERDSGARLALLSVLPEDEQPLDYARRWLALDPNEVAFLHWLLARLPRDEALEFLKSRLADRPVLVEWHRLYQHLMEETRPEVDLRPQYRQLVVETKDHPDALYLLARIEDLDEAEKLLEQAAAATPPSMYALRALGFRGLAEGRFADAVRWLEKALRVAPGSPLLSQEYWSALLAAGEYERLIQDVQSRQATAGENWFLLPGETIEQVRAYAARGDRARAQEMIGQLVRSLPPGSDDGIRQIVEAQLEIVLCCAVHDIEGFLRHVSQIPGQFAFESAFLRGDLQEAAGRTESEDAVQSRVRRALLYLAALQAKDQKLADDQWQLLLASLGKADRDLRLLGDMLAGRQPLEVNLLRRLPIDPREKRVLTAVAGWHNPDQGKELLELARRLDFHRDAVSLCLRKVLD